jgi:hypothetical protein
VADDVYERVRGHFSEAELINLRLAVVAINGWKRITISFPCYAGHISAESEHCRAIVVTRSNFAVCCRGRPC